MMLKTKKKKYAHIKKVKEKWEKEAVAMRLSCLLGIRNILQNKSNEAKKNTELYFSGHDQMPQCLVVR